MNELFANKKRMLKELIKALHAGAHPDEMKEKFKEALEDIGALEISKVEEELIEEGMPMEEVRRLCDVHLAVFRESLMLSGVKVNELPENRENAPCCGSGAAVRPVYRDLSLKIATKVLDQAPVSPLVTSCPFCQFNFSYAAYKTGSDKKIAYITDIILQALS